MGLVPEYFNSPQFGVLVFGLFAIVIALVIANGWVNGWIPYKPRYGHHVPNDMLLRSEDPVFFNQILALLGVVEVAVLAFFFTHYQRLRSIQK